MHVLSPINTHTAWYRRWELLVVRILGALGALDRSKWEPALANAANLVDPPLAYIRIYCRHHFP
jgi:hypothetical protein